MFLLLKELRASVQFICCQLGSSQSLDWETRVHNQSSCSEIRYESHHSLAAMFSLEDHSLPYLFMFLFWDSRDRWYICKIWGLFRLTDF